MNITTVGLGDEATFTDASRVFVLTVRKRETNPALPGQLRPLEQAPQFST